MAICTRIGCDGVYQLWSQERQSAPSCFKHLLVIFGIIAEHLKKKNVEQPTRTKKNTVQQILFQWHTEIHDNLNKPFTVFTKNTIYIHVSVHSHLSYCIVIVQGITYSPKAS